MRREVLKLALGATTFAILPITLVDAIVNSDISDTKFAELLRPEMEKILEQVLFNPNDEITRTKVSTMVGDFLKHIKENNGIYDYCVLCDETNNTPITIDKNELHVDVFLQNTHSVQMVYVPMILKPAA